MLRIFNTIIRDYFGFSRIESRGLLFLFIITGMVMTTSIIYEKYEVNSYQSLDHDQFLLEKMAQELDSRLKTNKKEKIAKAEKIKVARFNFDPNTADVPSLIKLGIPDYLARRIEKYRSKGGRFYTAQSLLKIYGFPEDLHRELLPFIRIAKEDYKKAEAKPTLQPQTTKVVKAQNETIAPKKIRLNINEVDSLALQQLKGIGKVISSRIVKFRNQLGGIHSVEQLTEVYNINEQALRSLQESVYVEDSYETQKININQADFKTLLAHPYISYEMAKGIINHRRIYGNFTSENQLKEVYQIKEELLVKLLPYLVI